MLPATTERLDRSMTMATRRFVGIDLGGTNLKAGMVDEDRQVLCKLSVPTEAEPNDTAARATPPSCKRSVS